MPHILNVQTGMLVHNDPDLVKYHPDKFRYVTDEEAAAIMAKQAARSTVVYPGFSPESPEAVSNELAEALGEEPKKKKSRK